MAPSSMLSSTSCVHLPVYGSFMERWYMHCFYFLPFHMEFITSALIIRPAWCVRALFKNNTRPLDPLASLGAANPKHAVFLGRKEIRQNNRRRRAGKRNHDFIGPVTCWARECLQLVQGAGPQDLFRIC